METDPEIERIRAIKAARMRLGLEKPQEGKKEPKVEVYSTQSCPYCHMAKQYLNSKGIKFKDIDVGKDMAAAQHMVSQTGEMGVPQLNINGMWVIGFDRPKIDAALTL